MAGTVVIDTLKSSTTGPVVFQNTSGTEVGQLCRAWVNFNGTTSPGTIRASFNVSSVSKTSTGLYTINFTNALADANYSIGGTVSYNGSLLASDGMLWQLGTMATTSVQVLTTDASAQSAFDPQQCLFQFFR